MSLKGKPKPRGFRLLIEPNGGDAYGVLLEESDQSSGATRRVARGNPQQAGRVTPALLDAVRTSGQAKTVLASSRQAPITLKEEAGVRLGLVLLATAPVAKSRRTEEMVGAVASLTAEESYYWYAKVTGPDAARYLRALRLFLADD